MRSADAFVRNPLALIVVAAIAMLLIVALAPVAGAQITGRATVTNRVAVTVPGFAVVKAVAQPAMLTRVRTETEVLMAVSVSANLPHRVVAQMPATVGTSTAAVYVRNAQNVYVRVVAGSEVVVTERGTAGPMRRHEVRVRVQSSDPAVVRSLAAALRYDAVTEEPMIAARTASTLVGGDRE